MEKTMDKTLAYSVLVTWLDCKDNPQRERWCYEKMLSLLLRDERETINFIRVQKDHKYLDLLAELLPELAYQFNSHLFVRQMENLEKFHDSEIWRQNVAAAAERVKAPAVNEMDF